MANFSLAAAGTVMGTEGGKLVVLIFTTIFRKTLLQLYCLINLSLMGEKYNKTKIAPEVAPPNQSAT